MGDQTKAGWSTVPRRTCAMTTLVTDPNGQQWRTRCTAHLVEIITHNAVYYLCPHCDRAPQRDDHQHQG